MDIPLSVHGDASGNLTEVVKPLWSAGCCQDGVDKLFKEWKFNVSKQSDLEILFFNIIKSNVPWRIYVLTSSWDASVRIPLFSDFPAINKSSQAEEPFWSHIYVSNRTLNNNALF